MLNWFAGGFVLGIVVSIFWSALMKFAVEYNKLEAGVHEERDSEADW